MGEAAAAAGYSDTGAAVGGEPGFSGAAGDAMGAAAASAGYSDTGAPEAGAPEADAEVDPEADLPALNAIDARGDLTSAVLANTLGLSRAEAEAIAEVIAGFAARGQGISLSDAAQMAGVYGGAVLGSEYGTLGAGPLAGGAFTTGTGVSGQGIGALGNTETGAFGLGGVQGQSGQFGGLSGFTSGGSPYGDLGGVQSGLSQSGTLSGTQGDAYSELGSPYGDLASVQSGLSQSGTLSGTQGDAFSSMGSPYGDLAGVQSGLNQSGTLSGTQGDAFSTMGSPYGDLSGVLSGLNQSGTLSGVQGDAFSTMGSPYGDLSGVLSGLNQSGTLSGVQGDAFSTMQEAPFEGRELTIPGSGYGQIGDQFAGQAGGQTSDYGTLGGVQTGLSFDSPYISSDGGGGGGVLQQPQGVGVMLPGGRYIPFIEQGQSLTPADEQALAQFGMSARDMLIAAPVAAQPSSGLEGSTRGSWDIDGTWKEGSD